MEDLKTHRCTGLHPRLISMRPLVCISLSVGNWQVLQNVVMLVVAAVGLPNIAFVLCNVMQLSASRWNLERQLFDSESFGIHNVQSFQRPFVLWSHYHVFY